MAKPAFKFPFARKTTAPAALPMGSPPPASAAIVPVQTATPARFSFRNFSKRKPATNSIALRGAQSREIVRSDARSETLGGIFAKALGPGVGASAAGFMDGTPVSKALEEATGGLVNLSDVALVVGGLARGAELDGKVPLFGPHLKRINTAFITGTIPAKFYNAGRRGAEHLWRDKGKPAQAAAKKSDEPVPGEMTVA